MPRCRVSWSGTRSSIAQGWARANTDVFRDLVGHLEAGHPVRTQQLSGGRGRHDGQSVPRDPTGRFPAGLPRHARARPVRHRAAVGRRGAWPAPVRGGEHPRHGARRWASRSVTSGPGSRCTRRPTPSSWRRIPGCGPTSASAWSDRSAASWARHASSRPAASGTCIARWRAAASEGSLARVHVAEQRGLLRETQLVMSLMEGFSDWVMDEVGEQVLPDVAGIRQPLRGAASPAPSGRRPDHRPAHRPRPEAGAVPARRALRGRCPRGRWRRGHRVTCGMAPRRCRPMRRWTSLAAGSQRIMPAAARARSARRSAGRRRVA